MITIPVLMYHDIDIKPNITNDYISVSTSKFQKDMKFVKGNYNTIFVQDLINYVYFNTPLPERPILITFDDGYLNVYQYAYDILCQLKIKATVSLITSKINEPKCNEFPKITWDDIKTMYNSGYIDFQSHSYKMHSSNKRKGCLRMPNETITEYLNNLCADYTRSKIDIESCLGNKVLSYFYPYGLHNVLTKYALKKCGCLCSFVAEPGLDIRPSVVIANDHDSLFSLQRITVTNRKYLSQLSYLL